MHVLLRQKAPALYANMKLFVIDSDDFFCGVSKGVWAFYSYAPLFSHGVSQQVGWFMSYPGLLFYRCARSEKIEFCHASGMKKRYSNLSEADDNMTWQQMGLWAIQCYFKPRIPVVFYPWVLVFFNVCKFSLKNWGTSIFVLHYGRASFKQFLGVFWWRSKWLVPGPSWFPISRCQSGSWESTEGGDSMSRSQLNSNEA